jgi:putative DNA primase/helicase
MAVNKSRPTEGEAAPKEFGGSVVDINTPRASVRANTRGMRAAATTLNGIIAQSTNAYLVKVDPTSPPAPDEVEQDLLDKTNAELRIENSGRVAGLSPKADNIEKNQLSLLKELTALQIAAVVAHLHHVVRVRSARGSADPDADLLAVYRADGVDKGIYVSSESELRATMRLYCGGMDDRKFRLARHMLYEQAPRRSVTVERDLVPVNNGLLDYVSKELHDFSPEMVFLSKSGIDFDKDAKNPIIAEPDGSTWDVATWIDDLSDDAGVSELLWQLIGAPLRPGVRWKKAAFLYSERGNNGKGTYLEVMRNVLGDGRHVSLPLDEMGKDFMLEPLTRASAILTDENNVGTFIDKAANMKAIITNDMLHINRKGKSPISYQFTGFMVQCLNEFPKHKDKSESLYRRQLFVPFRKWFGDSENPRIKEDYLFRPEVLRFVLKHVLVDVPEYYVLDTPAACQEVLNEFKRENDSVRDFWLEFEEQFAWELLPADFLLDVYQAWCAKTRPGKPMVTLGPFRKAIERAIEDSEIWMRSQTEKTRPGSLMSGPEPLTMRFNLLDWMSSSYTGSDPMKRSVLEFNQQATNYRWCLIRRQSVATAVPGDDDNAA